jgi:ubiquitin-like 1-activating enzyme E1 A
MIHRSDFCTYLPSDVDLAAVSSARSHNVSTCAIASYKGADTQETLDTAARASGTMIYATGTYGFYGYAYADLGEKYQFVYT